MYTTVWDQAQFSIFIYVKLLAIMRKCTVNMLKCRDGGVWIVLRDTGADLHEGMHIANWIHASIAILMFFRLEVLAVDSCHTHTLTCTSQLEHTCTHAHTYSVDLTCCHAAYVSWVHWGCYCWLPMIAVSCALGKFSDNVRLQKSFNAKCTLQLWSSWNKNTKCQSTVYNS